MFSICMCSAYEIWIEKKTIVWETKAWEKLCISMYTWCMCEQIEVYIVYYVGSFTSENFKKYRNENETET